MSNIAAELNQPDTEYGSVAPSVHRLASLVRFLWVKEYRTWQSQTTGFPSRYGERPLPSWDGGETPSGRRVKRAIWPSIAKYIVREQINPYVLIPLVFQTWDHGKAPVPPWLMSDSFLEVYRQTTENRAHQCQVELNIQKEMVKRAVFQLQHAEVDPLDLLTSIHRSLLNTELDLTPLYRVSAAFQIDYPEWTRHFDDPAIWQYLFDRETYDAVWEKFVPDTIRQSAAGLDAALRAS